MKSLVMVGFMFLPALSSAHAQQGFWQQQNQQEFERQQRDIDRTFEQTQRGYDRIEQNSQRMWPQNHDDDE